jgi:hypothetical protein
VEHVRVRGDWSVSPLREAKTLIAVLKQEGIAGAGLIKAFEKWAPKILGYSRADMDVMYRAQTGKPLSDYILLQQADKVCRYNGFGPEKEMFKKAIANGRTLLVSRLK